MRWRDRCAASCLGSPQPHWHRDADPAIIRGVTNQSGHPSVSIPASEGAEPVWLGRPSSGDGTCRGGYAIPVIERLGTRCAYCDRDLFASYEDWLNLSVDHVVPRNAAAAGIPVEWIEDLLNHVPCCRALQRVPGPVSGHRPRAG